MTERKQNVVGMNGVAIPSRTRGGAGFRAYEVHQRERVGQSTEKIKPIELISPGYLRDPYPYLATLREYYPCYRDWLENAYWVTRYDDVTSVFADDANFATRPKRWFLGLADFGSDLGPELAVLEAWAQGMDSHAEGVAEALCAGFAGRDEVDLATEFAGSFPLELLVKILDIPPADVSTFLGRYLAMQRGVNWEPVAQENGRRAAKDLCAYFEPIIEERRGGDGGDLVTAVANLEVDGARAKAADLVATLLETDHETLHGALANLWFLLLTHPDQLQRVRDDALLLKIAYLETLRHSTPVLTAKRFAKHEVERFGRLLPEGALVMCSAAAANRDPREFTDPDRFIAARKDICHREARGQYRADGLAMGITFGLGQPSKHPAVPDDRPRSLYALTRDAVLTASGVLLRSFADVRLAEGAQPYLTSLRLGEMHTCWQLPAALRSK
jgi:pulcherriminic acid synthase